MLGNEHGKPLLFYHYITFLNLDIYVCTLANKAKNAIHMQMQCLVLHNLLHCNMLTTVAAVHQLMCKTLTKLTTVIYLLYDWYIKMPQCPQMRTNKLKGFFILQRFLMQTIYMLIFFTAKQFQTVLITKVIT